MTPDHTPLDLDKLEAEAKEQLRPCNDGTPKRLHHTIIALISELRQAREGMVMWQNASIKINKRLTSAEEALGFYADKNAFYFDMNKPSGSPSVAEDEGGLARSHFEKYGKEKV